MNINSSMLNNVLTVDTSNEISVTDWITTNGTITISPKAPPITYYGCGGSGGSGGSADVKNYTPYTKTKQEVGDAFKKMDTTLNAKNTNVKSIKFDKKFTTVTWSDNTTTRVGCMLGDEYNKYEAFCSALAKKIFGSTSKVKHIVDTKDEQIEIDKQRKEREAQETAAKIRKARKDRIWIKKRAKEIAREKAAQELAEKMMAAKP